MYKYSVFTGFPYEETNNIRYDSIGTNNLNIVYESGRRLGKHNYSTNFEQNEDLLRNTLLQTSPLHLNLNTFTCWLWFESDVILNDCVLLGRGTLYNPIWSIKVIAGCIAFETGDGSGLSHSIIGNEITQGEHFVCISYNNTTKEKTLFFDGISTNGLSSVSLPTTLTGIAYGSYVDGALPFNGWIDSSTKI